MGAQRLGEVLKTWEGRVPETGEGEPEESARRRILRAKNEALFGPRFADKTFENYVVYSGKKQENCVSVCRSYASKLPEVARKGYTLTLVGNPGTGKNHLAYAIGRAVLGADYGLEVVTFLKVMRRIKTAWTTHEEREQEIIDCYSRVPFLILEEIGVQYGSETEKIFLFEILDTRYKLCKPYVLTSNLDQGEFRKYLDFDGHARIWDRLYETGTILYFDWESYRGRVQ